MPRILDQINEPNDIKQIEENQYNRLASDIRSFLLSEVSKTGGHLASNLGVVELTMALHLFLNLPEDKLIWDVGHQAYVHKLLTGRKKDFKTLRQFEGMSGFPKRKESDCDAFDTGHSSTSISVAMGLVKARDLSKKDQKIVAVIGDGALSGGMAYEALNNAGRLKSNLIVILNDNNMSISENVGGVSSYLGKVRSNSTYNDFKGGLENALKKVPKVGDAIVSKLKRSKDSLKHLLVPGMLFEDMGLTYIGPIDGHNIGQIMSALQSASRLNRAVLIHVVTKKGKGYEKAEKEPWKYHGVDPFDIKTGKSLLKKQGKSYTDIFSETMLELGKLDENVVAISAAMPAGTGLNAFSREYPKRFFDVGIAEEHAVTFAAGLAVGGFRPVVAIYSTFLQRAYDQIVHDVCVSKLPVIFAIDRAGIVGNDGETHQGMFDLSFLAHIPSMTVMAPKNGNELLDMLTFATKYSGPIAIRYPRGLAYTGLSEYREPIQLGKSEMISMEGNIAILAVGNMVQTAVEVVQILKEKNISSSLINVRFISPLDEEMIKEVASSHTVIVTMEENIKRGGYGECISSLLFEQGNNSVKYVNISLPNEFLEHGDPNILREKSGIDANSIVEKIINTMNSKC